MKFHPAPILFFLLCGCQSAPPQQTPLAAQTLSPAAIPEVVHTGRYTLVDITPAEALHAPLRQITTKILPAPKKRQPAPSRGDAMRYWLKDTGYGLCLPVTTEANQLFSSALPEIQREMGPVRIDAALQVIAGSAWTMTVDEVSRTVCWLRTPVSQTLS
ncbi:hypothetical protein BH012_20020 [Salmonella enterica]|nr:hypothetical protein [Salmonella enterica]EAX6603582.1 hypothetical protein [Salmonella enterica]